MPANQLSFTSPRDPDVSYSWTVRVEVMTPDGATRLSRQLLRTPYYAARYRVVWHGQTWAVIEGFAEGRGELLTLVSPDCRLMASFVLPSECSDWRPI